MSDAKPVWYRPYWVTFEGRAPGCVEAVAPETARAVGAELTGCKVLEVFALPYPAAPRLNPQVQPYGSATPSFCLHGEKCAGRTSCPERLSCVE